MYTYDYYIRQFQDAKIWFNNNIKTLDDDLFETRPNPDSWSPGEIIQHLNKTAEVYLPSIYKAIEEVPERLKNGGEPFKLGFLMRRFQKAVSPETETKLKTFNDFKPESDILKNRAEIESNFIKVQDEFIALLRKAQVEQISLDKVKFRNPIVKLLSMDANAAFAIIEAHQRRHFDQVKHQLVLHS